MPGVKGGQACVLSPGYLHGACKKEGRKANNIFMGVQNSRSRALLVAASGGGDSGFPPTGLLDALLVNMVESVPAP